MKNTGVEDVEKLQELINQFGKKMYQNAYLWKYVEELVVDGIYPTSQAMEKNVSIKNTYFSSEIPHVSKERADKTKKYLENLPEKEILIGMLGFRRPYKGKLEHSALDAYINVLDMDKYIVVESEEAGQEDDKVYTRNRNTYDELSVIEYYGQDEVDMDSLVDFFYREYIYPIEQAFTVKISRDIMLACIFRLATVLKIRKAYILFFEDVLTRVNPKVVCYAHGRAAVMCFLREAAQKKGIPTVEVPHGAAIGELIYPYTLSYADYYLTHSDFITLPMRKNGMDNVYTVGKPGIYERVQWSPEREDVTVITFVSSLECEMLEKSVRLAKRLEGKNYLVIYKAHTAEMVDCKAMEQIRKDTPGWTCLGGTVDIRDLYHISDIVVGMRSTAIVEALPYRKMKIIVLQDHDDSKFLIDSRRFYYDLDNIDEVKMVDDEESLYQEVKNYVRGRNYRDRVDGFWMSDEDAKKSFRDFIQIFLDGKRP